MLYWPHDQTITDRICKEQFITSTSKEERPSRRSSFSRKTLLISSGVLSLVVKRYHFLLPAYCLMNHHYHLLMETPDGNLSRGMRQLNGLYTQRFNKKHQRVGHLLQGRYQAILVDKEHYLLTLCRYVILNPVRAKIVKDLRRLEMEYLIKPLSVPG